MSEIWLPVVGWEGYYEVSDQGRVRGVDRVVSRSDGRSERRRGGLLSPKTEQNRGNYQRVSFRRNGERRTFSVHALVMGAFVGKRPSGMQIDHIDNNPANNRLSNLQYIDAAGNTNRQKVFGTSIGDRARNHTHHQVMKTHCPRGHALKDPNLVRSQKSKGGRTCRACACARSFIQRHHDRKSDFVIISDSYYSKFMKEDAHV